jgi:hypothetical protein
MMINTPEEFIFFARAVKLLRSLQHEYSVTRNPETLKKAREQGERIDTYFVEIFRDNPAELMGEKKPEQKPEQEELFP